MSYETIILSDDESIELAIDCARNAQPFGYCGALYFIKSYQCARYSADIPSVTFQALKIENDICDTHL